MFAEHSCCWTIHRRGTCLEFVLRAIFSQHFEQVYSNHFLFVCLRTLPGARINIVPNFSVGHVAHALAQQVVTVALCSGHVCLAYFPADSSIRLVLTTSVPVPAVGSPAVSVYLPRDVFLHFVNVPNVLLRVVPRSTLPLHVPSDLGSFHPSCACQSPQRCYLHPRLFLPSEVVFPIWSSNHNCELNCCSNITLVAPAASQTKLRHTSLFLFAGLSYCCGISVPRVV